MSDLYADNYADNYTSVQGNMPSVVGLNWQEATVALIEAGITPDNGLVVGYVFPPVGYFDVWPVYVLWAKGTGFQPGTVVAQSPAVNAQVAFNAPVTLTLASFPMGVSNLYSAGGYS